jgi:hypothetical protein
MPEKPKRASEYTSEQMELVRATCLYVATKLGDMMDDLVIVGGLVPSLIVDQATLPDCSAIPKRRRRSRSSGATSLTRTRLDRVAWLSSCSAVGMSPCRQTSSAS